MATKDDTLKKMINRVVKTTISQDPTFKDVYKADVFYLFQSPIRTAMCDYVYGIRIFSENDFIDKPTISSKLQKKITNVVSQVSSKTFCCTEVSFE
jgi:hypothetical protein